MAKLLVLALLLTASTAHAQPGAVEPSPPPAPPAKKSPGKALGLALGTFLGAYVVAGIGSQMEDDDATTGFAVAAAGLALVGPSAGHLYAGEHGRAALGVGVRVAAVGLMAYGVSQMDLCLAFCEEQDDDDSGAAAMVAVGGLVWIGSAVYDIVDAPSAARRANARARVALTRGIL